MRYLLGIDVGTTGVKAALFEETGLLVDVTGREYPLEYPASDQVEQDPEDWWRGTVSATRELLLRHPRCAEGVVGISVSSQGGCTLLLDDRHRPVGHAISWLDTRAKEIARARREEFGDRYFFERTGWTMRSCLSLTQLEWLRRYRPNEIARAALIVGTEDYMNMRLTGRAVTDRTNAAISQLMSLETLDWSDELLSLAGVSRSRLAPIVPSGEPLGGLCESAAQALGLPESAVVACGGHDQYCAALGAGVTDVGDCLLSCGTAWVPLAITDTLVRDPSMRVYPGPHVVPGRWGLLQSVPVAGVVLRWFRDKFCEASSYDALSDAAAQAPAGADGMLFVTAPAGEGGFHFDFVQLRHGRGHFARAIMEGIVCRVRQCLENLSELDTPVTRLVMIGGGARSGLWPRIVADMTGIRTELPEVSEAACRGAAILAGVGAGVFRNISEGMRRFAVRFSTVPSSPEQRAFYAAHYERFVRHATALGLAGR